MEMCAVKVTNALDTTFGALISAETEWAKTAGRRRSSSLRGAELLSASATAITAASRGAESTALATQDVSDKIRHEVRWLWLTKRGYMERSGVRGQIVAHA